MKRKNRVPRYHTGGNHNFHGKDRSVARAHMDNGNYDILPKRESMRMAIWRGPNCWGDNTSFGYCMSGEPTDRYLEKLLNRHIGKSFNEYYSKMCKKFQGKDRCALERFVYWKFKRLKIYGINYYDYAVIDGLIVRL
jgi:hypothetical protein